VLNGGFRPCKSVDFVRKRCLKTVVPSAWRGWHDNSSYEGSKWTRILPNNCSESRY
jgi:hypothetical protein